MLETLVRPDHDTARPDVVAAVRALAAHELSPLVQRIDLDGYYPESVLRAFGAAGAFGAHLPAAAHAGDLIAAVRAMSAAL